MRFSATKLLQGLLCSTPVLVLALAACGGGGGSSTPGTPVATYFTVSGTTSGLNSNGLKLLDNGGDALTVSGAASGVTGFTFPAINTSYNVTVLQHPNSPNKFCSVTNGSGTKQTVNVTNVLVSCVPAYTIGGSITGVLPSTGLVLQNNAGDNLLVPAGQTSFTFNTPVPASSAVYAVTVLTQPHTPAQTCTTNGTANSTAVSDYSGVVINCTTDSLPGTAPAPDRFAYAVNLSSDNVWAYAASGVPSSNTATPAGDGPYSLTADLAYKHLYVTNYNAGTVSYYDIKTDGTLSSIKGSIATGTRPVSIKIHPSGKFAYVANYTSNSVSVYSIDPATGALSSIDAYDDAYKSIDPNAAGNNASIPTKTSPQMIALDPTGMYAYVANAGFTPGQNQDCGGTPVSGSIGCVSVYSVNFDPVNGIGTGALTPIVAGGGSNTYIDAGKTPTSLAVDPSGGYLYVTNGGGAKTIYTYSITAGALAQTATTNTGLGPASIAIHPSGQFVYVVNTNDNSVWVYGLSGGALSHTIINATTEVTTLVDSSLNFPTSITIDSTGQYAYVANAGSAGSNGISVYSINYDPVTDTGTGGLTLVGHANSGANPYSVITAP